MKLSRFVLGCLVLAAAYVAPCAEASLFTNFNEYQTVVNGYQDDFNGPANGALNAAWLEYDGGNDDPNPLFVLTGNGTLQMLPAGNDPNKLLYNPGTAYSSNQQEVLALIRVITDPAGSSDAFRGGVTTVSQLSDGKGIGLLFREPGQGGNGNHFNLLNDGVVWGPATDPTAGGDGWNVGGWKWLRLQHNPSNNSNARIWDAGSTPEPTGWDLNWNQSRSGLAGLVTNSIGGTAVFEVDYVLIQAPDLPLITIPEPGMLGLLALAGAGLGLRRRRPHA